jgi:hypothetical protein
MIQEPGAEASAGCETAGRSRTGRNECGKRGALLRLELPLFRQAKGDPVDPSGLFAFPYYCPQGTKYLT